jgi:hypothetical protein
VTTLDEGLHAVLWVCLKTFIGGRNISNKRDKGNTVHVQYIFSVGITVKGEVVPVLN